MDSLGSKAEEQLAGYGYFPDPTSPNWVPVSGTRHARYFHKEGTAAVIVTIDTSSGTLAIWKIDQFKKIK